MNPAKMILKYWFGTIPIDEAPTSDRLDWWFTADPAIDHEIRVSFECDIRAAARGELTDWQLAADHCLALLILVDQFPRNLWRGSARAFELDSQALSVAEAAIRNRLDRRAHPVKRAFFYMPLMHAESAIAQQRCVDLFEKLVEQTDDGNRPVLKQNLEFARKHAEVIDRFGRFPSRNDLLGRTSTPEELAFIQEHGPGW